MPDDAVALVPFDLDSPHLDNITALAQRIWPDQAPQARHHGTYPGFKGIAVIDPASAVAGFVYGTTTVSGQW